jgi:hypothetical protein
MLRNISTLHFEQAGRSSMLGLIGITAWVDTSLAILPSVRFPTNAALGFVVGHLPCNRAVRYECGANRRVRPAVASSRKQRSRGSRRKTPRLSKIRCESQKANGRSGVSQPYLGQAGARRLSAAAPDHGGSRGMVLHAVYACSMCLEAPGHRSDCRLIQFHLKG